MKEYDQSPSEIIVGRDPDPGDVGELLGEVTHYPNLNLQHVLRDTETGRIINTATINPSKMVRSEMLFDIEDFVLSFTNHTDEVYAELVIREDIK